MSLHPAPKFDPMIETFAELPPLPQNRRLVNESTVEDRNQMRARYAGEGARAYAQRVGLLSGEEPLTVLGDLLGDLRHLCDALGLDFAEADRKGYNHYSEELVDDGY